MSRELTQRPHQNVTVLDWMQLERITKGLTLVEKAASQFNDPASQRHAAFLNGAIAAITWIAGGPGGSELYSALLDAQVRLDVQADEEV